MLTLTITDPHLLKPGERAALALLFSDAPATVAAPKVIAAEDRPDVGAEPIVIPRATEAAFERVRTLAPPVVPMPPAPSPAPALDAAAIFGGAAVPIPPAAPVPIPTPPAPPAGAVSAPPSAPEVTAAVPPAGVALDSKGLPWDARIHASTKGQNADGGWKKKKNTPDEAIKAVEAELRALMGIAPAKLLPAGAVAPEPGVAPTTFSTLMGWVTQQVAAGKLTQAEVAGVVTPIGLASVVGLNNRPDLIPQVLVELEAIIAGKVAA